MQQLGAVHGLRSSNRLSVEVGAERDAPKVVTGGVTLGWSDSTILTEPLLLVNGISKH